MSTLNVGTIKSISAAPPVFQNSSGTEKGQLCKAWVNFDGTFGTSPFTVSNGGIRGSFNISSVTDGGTGIYTINFTNAMGDSNYCSPCENGAPSGGRYIVGPESDGKTTTSARFFSQQSSTGANIDADEVSIAIFGDN